MIMTKSLPPKHIMLYADDDPDDLLLVQEAFIHYSERVEIITAANGFEAVAFLEGLKPLDPTPCLIILDVNMPRLNGKDALKEIRQMDRFKDTPVVLFTTSSMPIDSEYARKYGAGFITKPLDNRQMAKIADEFLDHCADEIRKYIKNKIN